MKRRDKEDVIARLLAILRNCASEGVIDDVGEQELDEMRAGKRKMVILPFTFHQEEGNMFLVCNGCSITLVPQFPRAQFMDKDFRNRLAQTMRMFRSKLPGNIPVIVSEVRFATKEGIENLLSKGFVF